MSNLSKTFSSSVSDFIWESDPFVVSGNLRKFGEQLVASFWVSRLFDSGGYHLVLAQEFPLSAKTERLAIIETRTGVEELLAWHSNFASEPAGDFQMSLLPGKDRRELVALDHLKKLRLFVPTLSEPQSVIARTALEYKFLVEFGIKSPSAVIAREELMQVKSIQQRIYLAREQGLLSSHGRGRTSSLEESETS